MLFCTEIKTDISLLQNQRSQRREMPEGTGATLDVGEYTETRKQKLNDERHKEYQELQQQASGIGLKVLLMGDKFSVEL